MSRIDDVINITIYEDDIIESIAVIEDMHEYCKTTKATERVLKALATAAETMKAFYCEHFTEDGHE